VLCLEPTKLQQRNESRGEFWGWILGIEKTRAVSVEIIRDINKIMRDVNEIIRDIIPITLPIPSAP
jgi:hypothetical protein